MKREEDKTAGNDPALDPDGLPEKLVAFFLRNRVFTFLLVLAVVGAGLYVMPFDWGPAAYRDPIPVDAIPDIGEKQVIVFTEWPGRSPRDVEDQVTYPLTINLQGIPGVREVRSFSMFGFSSANVIFHDEVEFYWARSRVLEKLAVAGQDMPTGVVPTLGPDATGLGQVFWYTLEGEGFGLEELRSLQDWYVRYALQGVEGVSEIASVGGHVREYQVDVSPEAMRRFGVGLGEVIGAVRNSNLDVGAGTIEHSGVEYIIRGRGFIETAADIENVVIRERNNVPVRIRDIGHVVTGPAPRRGVLDKSGAEAVGGIVTIRHGANPLEVISRVRERIGQLEPGLPSRVLPDGRVSRVEIVPFYDRTELIRETLFTLEQALILQVMITAFVIFLVLNAIAGSFAVSFMVPLGILLTFAMMKLFGVESNLMSLGGIAISIGAMVDMGVILYENALRHRGEREAAGEAARPLETVFASSREVAGAVVTAIATTIVSFLPVFALGGPEGRLFTPLAWTKTFALFASVAVALSVMPTLAWLIFRCRRAEKHIRTAVSSLLFAGGVFLLGANPFAGTMMIIGGLFFTFFHLFGFRGNRLPEKTLARLAGGFAAMFMLVLLTRRWMPLGLEIDFARNFLVVLFPAFTWMLLALGVIHFYPRILSAFLGRKALFLSTPALLTVFGLVVWQGFPRVFSPVPALLEKFGVPRETTVASRAWSGPAHRFPGLGREFMPSLHEGSFLWMPTTMPHAGIGEVADIMSKQNMLFEQIPEIDYAVGKAGRAESALDPAPLNMIETIIFYHPEHGPPDPETGRRERLWRDHIRSHRDIWREITAAGEIPGSTSAPMLGPIETRIIMLQTGMRAPMGVKVFGDNLADIENVGYQVAGFLAEVPGIIAATIQPDRVIGKPYLEINIDRERIARYGVSIRDVQEIIETGIGGMPLTMTVEGRERYPVRVRYQRELRDSPEALADILVPTASGAQLPLGQLADIEYARGPQVIKSENAFPVAYITFGYDQAYSSIDVVERARAHLENRIEAGALDIPPGVYYNFAGEYEQELSFQRTLRLILPISFFLIFLILFARFSSVPLTLIVFLQIFTVWSGGFTGIWLVGQEWFLDFGLFGANLRELYNLRAFHLSVPVWVGFLALFGIATDDAVVTATYLKDVFAGQRPASREEVRAMVVEGARKRIRPCFMTTITTVLALVPILTSTGRGAEVMLPMAVPIISGMTFSLLTLYITPVFFAWLREKGLKQAKEGPEARSGSEETQAPLSGKVADVRGPERF